MEDNKNNFYRLSDICCENEDDFKKIKEWLDERES